MIRVLVADDSPTARTLLVELLNQASGIQVVGQAGNGRQAVQLTERLRPSLVTMDIHMPELDGLAATQEIMQRSPTPIVIVTGSTEPNDVMLSMQALRAGALTVLRKPVGPSSPDFQEASEHLVKTIRSMAEVKVVRQWTVPSRELPAKHAGAAATATPVVAIAASTGGPAALQQVLCRLPSDFRCPILVVQHISPGFIPGLADWLDSVVSLRVKTAENREPALPGVVYLAPDGRHLGLSSDMRILLSDQPPVGGFRPSGTRLFSSVAEVCGSRAVAVILTGMGNDGVAGLVQVRQAGGKVVAQDEATCVVYGMPAAAVAERIVDAVLPVDAIAARLERLVNGMLAE